MRSNILVVVVGAAPLVLGACNMVPARATLRGFNVPVMLGPVDRVGYDGKPLPTNVVSEYEASVTHLHTESTYESGGYAYHVSREAQGGDFYRHAEEATAGFPDGEADIRLDEVKPQAYGLWLGAAMKARVDVHGKVVRVGGAK